MNTALYPSSKGRSVYRFHILAPLRERPLEAMGGGIGILRGLWSICWPQYVHNNPVQEFLISLMPISAFGWIVFLSAAAQLRLSYLRPSLYWWRVVPVIVQLVTIGVILTGYLFYNFRDVATAFYIAMWLGQVWIWGDFKYARKYIDA